MNLSLLAIFATSLIGSAHCLGMCGGLAAAVHSAGKQSVFAYHFGRLVTYSLLGAIAGTFGSVLSKFSHWLIIFFAVALIIYGAAGLFGYSKKIFPSFIAKRISKLIVKGKGYGGIAVGLLTGLLPCGWLYSFISIAAIQASAINGALILAAFWLGTLPWLFAPVIALRKLATPKIATTIVYLMVIFSGGMIISQRAHAYLHPTEVSSNSCH